MIVPNISFDPEIDDISSLFTSVFNRVEKQLELYDKVETKFQESLQFNEPRKLKTKMSKMRTNIINSQNQTDLIEKEVDSMNQWMISLEEQKRMIIKMDNIKLPNDFIQKFSTNSAMIKEFEHDLLFYLRNYINSYETPQVIRLKECFKRSFKMKIDRLEIFESISDRLLQAEKKFIEIDAENKNLTVECQKSDETLAQFSTSEAYLLVQKAKRQKFIIEDWAKRKKELLDQIDTLKLDLEMYQEDNKDKSSNTSILRKVQEVDEDYSKSLSKWNEQIRLVEEDFKVSITHQQSMFKQLEKDLLSNQLQLLASEKKKTMTEVRSIQASSNRTVSKFTSNRHSFNRKAEASFRKKALSYQDAIELLKTFHADELNSLKTTMDGVIEDIRNIILIRKDNSVNSTSTYLKKIQGQIELLRATTETAKRRISMHNVEKDIELKAINKRLVTVQGVVSDVQEHCSECEKMHNQLEEKLREITAKRNEFCMKLKKEIDENQTFINSANFIIVRLNQKLEEISTKITEKNDGFLFSKKFKEKVLKRSFSLNQFKKLSFDEIIQYRDNRNKNYEKFRKEDSLSIIPKEVNLTKNDNKSHFSVENKNPQDLSPKIKMNNDLQILKPNQDKSEVPIANGKNNFIQKVDSNLVDQNSEDLNKILIHSEKSFDSKIEANHNSLNNGDKITDQISIENESLSNPKNLRILTPEKKTFLIPQPPTALSPVPPAKRKIVTISSSAASLCGQIAVFDQAEDGNSSTERSVESAADDKDGVTEKMITKSCENKNEGRSDSVESKKEGNGTRRSLENKQSNDQVDAGLAKADSNNDDSDSCVEASCLSRITEKTESKELANQMEINIASANDSIKSISSPPSSSSAAVPSHPSSFSSVLRSSSSHSSLSSEKVKTKAKPQGRAKNQETIPTLSSSSSSPLPNASATASKSSSTKYEKVPSKEVAVVAESCSNLDDQISTEKNDIEKDSKIVEFRLKSSHANNRQTGKQSASGRIKIEYDRSLTASITSEKKKRKKINVSPRRKRPPKQIPNDQPSFVNNRPPRHLTYTPPIGLKGSIIRSSNNCNVNVKIVNINESVSTQMPIGNNDRFNRFNDSALSEINNNDDDDSIKNTDTDDECVTFGKTGIEKKISKKKQKKLSVKKKSKKENDRKKILEQKINGKVLAFSLPTAERRALSVKNVPKNGIIDALRNNGSLNLNNRINGSIISVQHF